MPTAPEHVQFVVLAHDVRRQRASAEEQRQTSAFDACERELGIGAGMVEAVTGARVFELHIVHAALGAERQRTPCRSC